MNTRHQSAVRIWKKAFRASTSLLLAALLSQSILIARDQQSPDNRRKSQAETSHSLVSTERDGTFSADDDVRRMEFGPDGLRYQPKIDQSAGSDFRYRLKEVISGDSGQTSTQDQTPGRHDNEVYYARADGVLEKYRAVEGGVEQVFTLQHPIAYAPDSDLVIRGEVATSLQPESASLRTLGGVNYLSGRAPIIHYSSPVITDATGREYAGELRLEGDQLDLVVDGFWLEEAVFPVTVSASIRSYSGSQASAIGDTMTAAALMTMENWPIWRVQLRVQIADVASAGTNDYVFARLNSSNLTWMDYGRNDFERNSVFTYDLIQGDVDGVTVAKLSDITQLSFGKNGSDGLCLRKLTLYVNGVAIYSLDYGASGKWLDNDTTDHRTITVSSAGLRAHPYWVNFPATVPGRYMTRAELESRIEAIVGHSIKGTSVYWGHYYGRAVEVTKKDDRTIHVDLDLAYDLTAWADPEVDFDFDVSFGCSGSTVMVTTKNAKVDVDAAWYWEVLGGFAWFSLTEYMEHRIEGSFDTMQLKLNTPWCPNIYVYGDGEAYTNGTVMMEF